ATAVYAHRVGIPVTLVLFPEPVTPAVESTLCIERAIGAELRFTTRMETVPLAVVAARAAYRNEQLVVIPPGGSNPIGALGYVDAALELAEQIAAGLCPVPRAVYVAGGTLGTAAGLAVGFALTGLETTVKATRVTSTIVSNERVLRRLIRGVVTLLAEAGVPAPPVKDVLRRVELLHDYIGPGYAVETSDGRAAMRTFAAAGLTLDPTYTAKTAAAFLAAAKAARAGEPGPLLYWHTISATMPVHLAGDTGVDALPPPFQRYLSRGHTPH
ncbi:MAG TPA: pyridoxal-phosphate dependent enzyme, partial [Longimicrobiales bacterium]|nr:pyridoxal-phosphate dependent enzyme [Longimicrobiales bacterium]